MKIYFENEDFVFVEKNCGLLTTPSRHQNEDPRSVLGLQLQNLKSIQIYPVHRLDFEVSGIVMFAKKPKAHAQANFWFENHLVQKTYEAWTTGDSADLKKGDSQFWKNKLLRGKRRAYESPLGKWSETEAIFRGHQEEWLAWELRPKTGRPHQLRVHLAQAGFPIVGDALYGSETPYRTNGIALRAVKLNFSQVSDRGSLPDQITGPGLAE